MPRLFAALPVPEEIADELSALQSGVPDARWVPAENFHVTLCFAGEVQGATMRDLEEELSDIEGPPFPISIAGVEQFSSGKQPRALVATVERSDRLDWLQQKVSTVARNCGIEVERRKFRPHVTLARFSSSAEGIRKSFEGSSLETIKHMVAAGMGVTVVPQLSVPPEPHPHIAYIPFEDPVPTRRVVLAWRRSFTRYEAIAALRNAIYACPLAGVQRLTH